jgi:hypothetical protein
MIAYKKITVDEYERLLKLQEKYDLLYQGKLEEQQNTINVPNYYKQKYEELKEVSKFWEDSYFLQNEIYKNDLKEINRLQDKLDKIKEHLVNMEENKKLMEKCELQISKLGKYELTELLELEIRKAFHKGWYMNDRRIKSIIESESE